jgi:PBS lyase HEAT-like repeat
VGFLVLLGLFALAGCGTWDDFRASGYSVKALFVEEDPLVVLKNSNDGVKRGKALRLLREPKQQGGTDQDQEAIFKILQTAATTEPEVLCRVAAIESLGHFKDPRVVAVLYDAYDRAGQYTPEMASILRCQALAAMGETKNPEAVQHLVTVLRAPALERTTSEEDQRYNLDERKAAARALSNFKDPRASQALAGVMKGPKQETALRNAAHESLQVVTGKRLPFDHKDWDRYVQPGTTEPRDAIADQKKDGKKSPITPVSGGGDKPKWIVPR